MTPHLKRLASIPPTQLAAVKPIPGASVFERPQVLPTSTTDPFIKSLLDANRARRDERLATDPHYYRHLAQQQAPKIVWFGCSDSRKPPDQLFGLQPGSVFVNRVVGVPRATDLATLSALIYAVETLQVEHVILCGHYGCGAMQGALSERDLGVLNTWLKPVRNIRDSYRDHLRSLPVDQRANRLCELTVGLNLLHYARSMPVQNAWSAGKSLMIHGMILDMEEGLVRPMEIAFRNQNDLAAFEGANDLTESESERDERETMNKRLAIFSNSNYTSSVLGDDLSKP